MDAMAIGNHSSASWEEKYYIILIEADFYLIEVLLN